MQHTIRRLTGRCLAVALSLVLAAMLAACGEDEPTVAQQPQESQSQAEGNAMDRAFVAEMVPHHRSAVEMAEMALEQGESAFVRDLARDIVRTQEEEISTMGDIDQRLAEQGVERGTMDMADHEMGMDMGEDAMAELRDADPFDRAFIDEMVPHHQGAVRMARMQLEMGQNPELQELAQEIVDAQAREIEAMNREREERFGGPSPAGGVPAEGEQPAGEDHGGMDMG
jgi:uncharacterized protein (DUF305 family)